MVATRPRSAGCGRGGPGHLVGPPTLRRPGRPAGRLPRGDRLGGLTLAAEVGDWRRFARAAQFMGFCGLVPSEDSSGHSVHRGRLTKAGNAHLRAQLAWVGLDLPASTVCGPRDCRPPARAGPRGDRPRSCACPLGSAPWPPARTPNPSWPPRSPANWPGSCGRDGGLTPPPPQGCAPSLLIGRGGEHHRYDAPGRRRCRTDPRRHDAAASPKPNWSGHLPASCRHAVPAANISVAASRSTVSRRVVPHPEPPDRPHRRRTSTHTRAHAPQRARLAAAQPCHPPGEPSP